MLSIDVVIGPGAWSTEDDGVKNPQVSATSSSWSSSLTGREALRRLELFEL